MKVRIIREEGTHRIQEQVGEKWQYAKKAKVSASSSIFSFRKKPIDFQKSEDAEKFIDNYYVKKVVKEFDVE